MTLSSPQPGAWLLTIESMARRLVNTTLKNQKDTFRFELWDMDSSSVDLDYVVEFDVAGFTIDWKGSDKDSPSHVVHHGVDHVPQRDTPLGHHACCVCSRRVSLVC